MGEQFQQLHSACDFDENRLNFKFIFIACRALSIPWVLSLKENSFSSPGRKSLMLKSRSTNPSASALSDQLYRTDREPGLSFFPSSQMSFRCFIITKVCEPEPHTSLFLTVYRYCGAVGEGVLTAVHCILVSWRASLCKHCCPQLCSVLYMSKDSRLPLHRMIRVFKISTSCCLHLLVLQSLFCFVLFCFNLDPRNLKVCQLFWMSFCSDYASSTCVQSGLDRRVCAWKC